MAEQLKLIVNLMPKIPQKYTKSLWGEFVAYKMKIEYSNKRVILKLAEIFYR